MLETFKSILESKEVKINEAKTGSVKGTSIHWKVKINKGDRYLQEWYFDDELFAVVSGDGDDVTVTKVEKDVLAEALGELSIL
jgi:hypothetical protein